MQPWMQRVHFTDVNFQMSVYYTVYDTGCLPVVASWAEACEAIL